MYLLKSDLPPTVLVYLNELNLKSQSPAWLMISAAGTLTQWGGHLDYYGISGLQKDAPATTQLRFLEGLLPLGTEAVELPCIETDSGIYADIHVFEAFGCVWTLLVDTTTRALEHRQMQQRGNEMSLRSGQESRARTQEFASRLFTGLEFVVLDYLPDGSLKLCSGIPAWFARICPTPPAELSREALSERFPFLANFLIDADQFYQTHDSGRLRSGVWIEGDSADNEYRLEASAVCLDNTRLLLFETMDFADKELQSILQKARDGVLSYQRLAKTEAALRRSETRNRALLDAMPDLMLTLDNQGTVLDYKARPDRNWAITPERFHQKNVTEFLPPEMAQEILNCLKQAHQTGQMQVYELELPREEQPAFFEFRVVSCGEDELLAIIRDITERKQTEQAEKLRHSEQYFRSLIEYGSDIIVVMNEDGTIKYESPSIKRVLGYDPDQRLGQSWFEQVHPDDLDLVVDTFRALIQFPGITPSITFRLRHHDGTWQHVEAVGNNLLDKSEIGGLVINFRDVTERKQAEEEHQKLVALVENSSDLIGVTTLHGQVLFINNAGKELLGIDDSVDIKSLTPQDYWTEADYHHFQETIWPLIRSGKNWLGEFSYRHFKTGELIPTQLNVFTIKHPQTGRAVAIATVSRDIREHQRGAQEQARLQESLRRSETMAAMGSLVAGVAHEVRNPLFSISATLDAFEARFTDQKDHQQYLTVLRGEINRLSRLMQDLLEYGKPSQLTLAPAQISEIMQKAAQACQTLAEKTQVKVVRQPGEDFTVMVDHQRLQQVFQNLIENAIQHSPAAGTVSVTTESCAVDDQPWLCCSVRDQGQGFQPEDLPKVFDPFYSRRRGGTGLGLSIVQRIVEEHGGHVDAGNNADGGAIVTVRLPLQRKS